VVGSRTATAVGGVAGSLFLTGALYYYTGQLLVFLAAPFVPLLFHRRAGDAGDGAEVRTCPVCGYASAADHAYCPHDGTKLE